MTWLQEGIQVPLTHIGQSHPEKAFNGSHPLKFFLQNSQSKAHEKVPDVRDIARYLKRGPTNIVYGFNVWYPPVNLCVYNPSETTTH